VYTPAWHVRASDSDATSGCAFRSMETFEVTTAQVTQTQHTHQRTPSSHLVAQHFVGGKGEIDEQRRKVRDHCLLAACDVCDTRQCDESAFTSVLVISPDTLHAHLHHHHISITTHDERLRHAPIHRIGIARVKKRQAIAEHLTDQHLRGQTM
jgi:hypothetical protein